MLALACIRLLTGMRDGVRFMVTNERFGEFVGNTSYKTDSEKYGWSFVFLPMLSMRQQREIQQVGGRALTCMSQEDRRQGGVGAKRRNNRASSRSADELFLRFLLCAGGGVVCKTPVKWRRRRQ